MRTVPPTEKGKYRAIASGAIANGKPVIVNSDGTVSEIAKSGNAAGSQVEFNDSSPRNNVPVFVPSENKIALHSIYVGGGGGALRMTTISGTTPSFATANTYQASNISSGEGSGVTICSSNGSTLDRVLITYQDVGNSRYGTAIVYKPSDGTFGSKVVFESAQTSYMAATYDSNSDRVVISYKDQGNSNYGTAVVGAVSGTSVSFGTPVVYNAGTTNYQANTFDSNSNKVVILYQDGGNGEKYTAIVGTVDNSDNSISFGSEVAISAGGARSQSNSNIAFDSNSNKVLVGYRDNADSGFLKLVVGTVSGTSISFGTILDAGINNASVDYISIAFNPDRNKFGVAFQRSNPVRDCAVLEATISGTNVTVTSPMSVNSVASTFDSGTNGLVTFIGMAYDTNVDKFLVAYIDDDNGVKGEAQVLTAPFEETNLTSTENYIGIANSCSFHGTTETITVTVAGGIFYLDGVANPVIQLLKGHTYIFDQADGTNNGHPLHFKDSGGSQYTTGVTVTGTAGNAGAKVTIAIASDATEPTRYYCTVHGNGMGNTINLSDSFVNVDVIGTVNNQQSSLTAGQQYFVQTDGTLSETADSPSVFAGTAISATELVVKE